MPLQHDAAWFAQRSGKKFTTAAERKNAKDLRAELQNISALLNRCEIEFARNRERAALSALEREPTAANLDAVIALPVDGDVFRQRMQRIRTTLKQSMARKGAELAPIVKAVEGRIADAVEQEAQSTPALTPDGLVNPLLATLKELVSNLRAGGSGPDITEL